MTRLSPHCKQLERIVGTARQVVKGVAIGALAVQHREPQADPAHIEAVVNLADLEALRYREFAERQQPFADGLANTLVPDDLLPRRDNANS